MNQPAPPAGSATEGAGAFACVDEAFADIRLLRYRVPGFETLPLRQKTYIYHLAEAALWGRDILFDQNGRYNLRIRRLLEAVYTRYDGPRQEEPFSSLAVYLKRVWFSNGIHHHYGGEKLVPGFDPAFLRSEMERLPREVLPLAPGETADDFCREVFPVIFDPDVMPMRVNHSDGADLLLTSACNYYEPGVTQAEAEAFYAARKDPADPHPVMTGLNSRLVKEDGVLSERTWRIGGLYGKAIEKIVGSLLAARPFADNAAQQAVIDTLVDYYRTGDLRTFSKRRRGTSTLPTVSPKPTATRSGSKPAGRATSTIPTRRPRSAPRCSAATPNGSRTTRPSTRASRRRCAAAFRPASSRRPCWVATSIRRLPSASTCPTPTGCATSTARRA